MDRFFVHGHTIIPLAQVDRIELEPYNNRVAVFTVSGKCHHFLGAPRLHDYTTAINAARK